MEKVRTIRVYNLLNANGERLRLNLGYTVDDYGPAGNGNAGWRWSFVGKNIPMPVRSRTWFCGFPEDTMISWLKGNGWYVQTRVDMGCGYAEVFELPKANDEPIEGNEEPYELSELAVEQGESALKDAVKMLYKAGSKLRAVMLYRYVHPCNLQKANYAVNHILYD